jgi:type I restriction enzyme R subunit
MLGRGTRLCPDLFEPGKDKEFFFVFDYCQNLEYFSQNIPATEGALSASLSKRLFTARLELIAALDKRPAEDDQGVAKEPTPVSGDPASDIEVRQATAGSLQREVAAMKLDNFVVRPRRRLVEKYSKAEAWTKLPPEAIAELSHEVAGLPTELDPENERSEAIRPFGSTPSVGTVALGTRIPPPPGRDQGTCGALGGEIRYPDDS